MCEVGELLMGRGNVHISVISRTSRDLPGLRINRRFFSMALFLLRSKQSQTMGRSSDRPNVFSVTLLGFRVLRVIVYFDLLSV